MKTYELAAEVHARTEAARGELGEAARLLSDAGRRDDAKAVELVEAGAERLSRRFWRIMDAARAAVEVGDE